MERAGSGLKPGSKLDRYELLCTIASGGMATVWLARLRGKRGFEKLFAIKTIKTELIDDVRFQEMFLDEARIASSIQHPNVAQILDLGEQDDVLYIVMEWVDGESLAKIRRLAPKRKAPLPLGVTLRVLSDTCAGLHAAHELKDVRGESVGVVHRDVSPQNILLSPAGSVKVIDFGIAKATNRSAGDTKSGVVKGKIHYMAPEQAGGLSVDRRADVWAVGVCLYELVTGKLPFDGDSDVDVVRRLLGKEPAPGVGDEVPEPVRAILAHSLVRDPGERFGTAAAMQRALETAIDKIGEPATNEDVGEYLRAHFADLVAERREIVSEAIESAQGRDKAGDLPTREVRRVTNEDVAFAPTVMSERQPGRQTSEDVNTVELTKRRLPASTDLSSSRPSERTKSSTRARDRDVARAASATSKEHSKLTLGSAALEMEDEMPAGVPRRRGWLRAIALVAIAAGCWWGFRMNGFHRVSAFVSQVTGGEPSPAPAASPAPAVSLASAVPSTSASASPSASTASSVGARGDASAAHAHVDASAARPGASLVHPGTSPVAPTSSASATPAPAPSASSAAPAPSPMPALDPPPAPAPTPAPGDNPY